VSTWAFAVGEADDPAMLGLSALVVLLRFTPAGRAVRASVDDKVVDDVRLDDVTVHFTENLVAAGLLQISEQQTRHSERQPHEEGRQAQYQRERGSEYQEPGRILGSLSDLF
jgi:hypothetical protein